MRFHVAPINSFARYICCLAAVLGVMAWNGPEAGAHETNVQQASANSATSGRSSASGSSAVFASIEARTNADPSGGKSAALFRRVEQERSQYSACDDSAHDCPANLGKWRNDVKAFGQLNGLDLLKRVNTSANGLIEHRDDDVVYGEEDYWATPAESLMGYGDCEDFAILKYVTLRELGFTHDQLRIVIVWHSTRQIGHAVLTVKLNDRIYVLDSLSAGVKVHSEVSHYEPVYSLNRTNQWLNLAVRTRETDVALNAQ